MAFGLLNRLDNNASASVGFQAPGPEDRRRTGVLFTRPQARTAKRENKYRHQFHSIKRLFMSEPEWKKDEPEEPKDSCIPRKTYSGSFKARVLSDLILGRKSLDELARENNLHPNQIKNWKSLLLRRAEEVLEDRRRTQKK